MLSREALQLLELMPVWKPRSQPSALDGLGLEGRGVAGLFVGAADPAAHALFGEVSRAAVAAGWPAGRAAELVVIGQQAADIESFRELLIKLDPRGVIVFGEDLGQSLRAAFAPLEGRIMVFAPLQELFAQPKMKAKLWQAVCELLGQG